MGFGICPPGFSCPISWSPPSTSRPRPPQSPLHRTNRLPDAPVPCPQGGRQLQTMAWGEGASRWPRWGQARRPPWGPSTPQEHCSLRKAVSIWGSGSNKGPTPQCHWENAPTSREGVQTSWKVGFGDQGTGQLHGRENLASLGSGVQKPSYLCRECLRGSRDFRKLQLIR